MPIERLEPDMQFPEGFMLREPYALALRSPLFAALEAHSARFNQANQALLARYERKWVLDPLHQWSRQYEYPYVATRVAGARRLLDAGSGFSFFPYYLAERDPDLAITCIDSDAALGELHAVSSLRTPRITFAACDMRATGLASASFDAISCISVLEHTGTYGEIVDEFHRLLTPDGVLVLTFDVSLDGRSEISQDRLPSFLTRLEQKFRYLAPPDLTALASDALVRTTDFTRASGLLPWRHPRLSAALAALKKGRLPRGAMKRLGCCCLTLYKR